MGRILWGGAERARGGSSSGGSFNPLTNGADIVGSPVLAPRTRPGTFQSPDQWGGYCGWAAKRDQELADLTGFNPLTNGADIAGTSRPT